MDLKWAIWNLKEFDDVCSLMELLVSLFILTIVLARCTYPVKSSISKDQLTLMFISFITAGADSVELYSYIDDLHLKGYFSIVYGILGNMFWIYAMGKQIKLKYVLIFSCFLGEYGPIQYESNN
jgi:hypothetical protein